MILGIRYDASVRIGPASNLPSAETSLLHPAEEVPDPLHAFPPFRELAAHRHLSGRTGVPHETHDHDRADPPAATNLPPDGHTLGTGIRAERLAASASLLPGCVRARRQ